MLWDKGEWFPETDDVENALGKGELKFTLQGKKLRGSWVLVRTRGYGSRADKSWLLIKHRDRYASEKDIAAEKPRSVLSRRLLADIARESGGDIEKAATGDPGKALNSRARTASKSPQGRKRAKS